jgi:hypothetical protein
MRLLGADASSTMSGEDQTSTVNYLLGSDRSKWHTGVPAYTRVKAHGVYPGVDLVFYGNRRQFEYDFVVAPGADPRAIRLAFDGVIEREGRQALSIDARGDLVLATATGDLRLQRPLAYQEIGGVRRPVVANYVVRTAAVDARSVVGVEVPAYDATQPLVIDPVLDYATYLGVAAATRAWPSPSMPPDMRDWLYGVGGLFRDDRRRAGAGAPGLRGELNAAGSALLYATYLGVTATIRAPGSRWTPRARHRADRVNQLSRVNVSDEPGRHRCLRDEARSRSSVPSRRTWGQRLDVGLGIAVDGAGRIYVTGYEFGGLSHAVRVSGPGGRCRRVRGEIQSERVRNRPVY